LTRLLSRVSNFNLKSSHYSASKQQDRSGEGCPTSAADFAAGRRAYVGLCRKATPI
jgi:hypothetical protein